MPKATIRGQLLNINSFMKGIKEKRGIALKCLEKALTLIKNDEELINDMVNLYYEEGDFRAAEEKLKLLINLKTGKHSISVKIRRYTLEGRRPVIYGRKA